MNIYNLKPDSKYNYIITREIIDIYTSYSIIKYFYYDSYFKDEKENSKKRTLKFFNGLCKKMEDKISCCESDLRINFL